jgi:hypothetical protein
VSGTFKSAASAVMAGAAASSTSPSSGASKGWRTVNLRTLQAAAGGARPVVVSSSSSSSSSSDDSESVGTSSDSEADVRYPPRLQWEDYVDKVTGKVKYRNKQTGEIRYLPCRTVCLSVCLS